MLTSGRATYLDSSALVKLVIDEAESIALDQYLVSRPIRMSCELALVEVIRAVRLWGNSSIDVAREVVEAVDLVRIERPMLETAARLDPIPVRSLDAIHLAAALTLGNALGEIITYDKRMADAARALGLRVVMPGRD